MFLDWLSIPAMLTNAQGVYKAKSLNTSKTTAGRTIVQTFLPFDPSPPRSICARRSPDRRIFDLCQIRTGDCVGTATRPRHQHWHLPWSAAARWYAQTVQHAKGVAGSGWAADDSGFDERRPRDGPDLLGDISMDQPDPRRLGTLRANVSSMLTISRALVSMNPQPCLRA